MEPLPEPPPSPADAILSVCRQLADEKMTLAEAVAHATTQRASLDKLDAELLSRLVGALCDGDGELCVVMLQRFGNWRQSLHY